MWNWRTWEKENLPANPAFSGRGFAAREPGPQRARQPSTAGSSDGHRRAADAIVRRNVLLKKRCCIIPNEDAITLWRSKFDEGADIRS